MLRHHSPHDQAAELLRRSELMGYARAFADAGIRAVLFKGAALAYTHYSYPHLRPRLDVDLLVDERDRGRAATVLEQLGYEKAVAVERDAVFSQATFSKRSVGEFLHLVDLHWKLANRPPFRDLFSFEELYRDSVEIPALGFGARALGPVHALLWACIHPVAHHRCEWPRIWHQDISLIARALTDDEWGQVRDLMVSRRVSAICKQALSRTADLFPGSWLERSRVGEIADRTALEPSAAYLRPDLEPAEELVLDLKATKGLVAKARLVLSHAFPDASYMRRAFGASGWPSLTLAYGKRLLRGGQRTS